MKRSAQGAQRGQQCAELERALEETRLLMAQAYNGFNAVTDEELLESYIYEIQALRCRYSYLLKQRKETEEQSAPAQRSARKQARKQVTPPAAERSGHSAALPVA